ncbi:MAG: RNA chaperone Hfq [Succinivibrionaceae bacterium]|nr:RNA chaperone Hfq [Succinivibrionaceae bacterium]
MQGGGQDAALKWMVDNQSPVCIFLVTGVKFEGIMVAFDQYTVSIQDIKGHQQLIYKDKISTISLRRPRPRPRAQEAAGEGQAGA